MARSEQRQLQSTAEAILKRSEEEAAKYTELQNRSTQHRSPLAQLKQWVTDLKVALLAKKKEVIDEELKLADANTAVENQEAILSACISKSERAWAAVPDDIGSDDPDLLVLTDIDQIHVQAFSAIQDFLHPQ